MKQKLYLVLLLFTLVCCKNQSKSDLNKINIAEKTETESLKYREVIFGLYCGECDESCAPMFRLTMDKNGPNLWADFEDTYFSPENKLEFKTELNQKDNIALALGIVEKIPDTLYNWKSNKETFGCPDCTDGCGYFLEFTKVNGDLKSFNLEDLLESNEIPKEVLEFTNLLAERINMFTE